MSDSFRYAQLQPFALYGGGAVAGDTTITLASMTDIDGAALSMSTTFGAIGFGTLEPGSGTLEEQISFSGLTNNANGTTTLTGVKSVTFTYPYTQTAGLSKNHAGATTFVISNTSGFYDELTSKSDDETITGTWTFTVPNFPTMDAATPLPTLQPQLATKAYADSLAIAGAPNATTSVQGLVQLATQAQVDAKTTAGSTGASLVPTMAEYRSTLLSDYVIDTGAADAYVITPVPAISAYTTGQIFTFKAVHTNTTTSTLNVSGLGVKTIKKLDGATNLASGDIVSGQIIKVEYDGTNFQMGNPVANAPATISQTVKFGGTGADGALAITSGVTTINLAGAQYLVKNYTSISITGTGSLAFSNPHANGTIVELRSQGAVALTSSAAPMIDCSSLGATGGTGGATTATGNTGPSGTGNTSVNTGVGTGGLSGAGNPNGVAGGRITGIISGAIFAQVLPLMVGAGGGGGGGSTGFAGGAGGRGGGVLYIECAGALNFTTSAGISMAGAAGAVATGGAAGGGGGGGGGACVILYNTLTSAAGTITVTAGAGGAASGAGTEGGNAGSGGGGGASQSTAGVTSANVAGNNGGAGGAGGAGWSLVASNVYFT